MKSFLSLQFHHLFTPVRSCVHKLARISSPSTPSRILCAAEVSVFTPFINSTSSQNVFIMPPTRKGAGGIMFSGCPSIRTGISLPRNLKNPWVDFYHTWPRGAPWGVDELIRFWARSAHGQWSKVNELGLNMLFLPRYREISRTPGWIFIKFGTG